MYTHNSSFVIFVANRTKTLEAFCMKLKVTYFMVLIEIGFKSIILSPLTLTLDSLIHVYIIL